MDANQLYQEAQNLLNGTNGFPKNPKKGYAKLKEAADAGNQKAREEWGEYLWVEKGKYAESLPYYEAGTLSDQDAVEDYLFVLTKLVAKNKKDPTFAQTAADKAFAYHDKFDAESYYFYGVLLQKGYPEKTKEIHDSFDMAAFLGSEYMPDETYASIGRERGVFTGKTEMDIWQKNTSDGKSSTFVPCNRSAEEAWSIAKANLEEKATKKILTYAQISKLLKGAPQAQLEYQPIVKCAVEVGTPNVRYKYDNPSYSTVSSGSTDYTVDMYWTNYCATFKTKQTQRDLWKVYKNATFTSNCVDGRVRIHPVGQKAVIERAIELSSKDATEGARQEIKEAFHKAKNWDTKYIEIIYNDKASDIKELSYVFVPFYFFTVSMGGKKSVTVRVNAYSGEVDYFVDNPFGQFSEDDNVAQGGGASQSKAERNAKSGGRSGRRGGSRWSRLKRRISLIPYLILIALAIVGFTNNNIALGVIMLVLLPVYFFIRKKFIK